MLASFAPAILPSLLRSPLSARAAPLVLAERSPSSAATPAALPWLLQAEPAMAIGVGLLLLLLANRLVTDVLLNSQSRADLIATVAPTLIILKALGDLDITPREAESIVLTGEQFAWIDPSLPAAAREELEWAAESLLVGACATVALWRGGRTLLLRGVLPSGVTAAGAAPEGAIVPGPLLTKAASSRSGAPDYLPALQLLPGRLEFSYLPEDTQGVLMLPLSGDAEGVLVLGSDRQRGLSEEDVAWARAVAGRLAEALNTRNDV